mmetsp:Transcript_4816/g.8742  ORF Transcript_4816/g.8742 Transcript_4816/m.8742 type:complete len:355 (-) Transcript_4816:73-1137(-)
MWGKFLAVFLCPIDAVVAHVADGDLSSCSACSEGRPGSILIQQHTLLHDLAAPGHTSALAQSHSLSNTMQQLAARLPNGSTKELLESFKVCGSCTNWQRLGEEHDGGYLVCMDAVPNSQLRAAYSIGISDRDQFSLDVYNTFHVPVYQLDCTVANPASICPDCHFSQVCIKGASGAGAHPVGPNMDLTEVLTNTGQSEAPRGSLIMKMDIEGSEWPVFADGAFDVSKFQQIVLEFHGIDQEASHAQFAQAMRNILAANFRVAHIHGNNWGFMYNKEGASIPNVLEVTMLLDAPALPTCVAQPTLSPLDKVNSPLRPALSPFVNLEPTLAPPVFAPPLPDQSEISGALDKEEEQS